MKQSIILLVGASELAFDVTTNDHNDYINGLMPDNKVAPAHNLLMRTVKPEHKEQLKKLIEGNPGAPVQMASAVMAEFAPVLEISVKK